MRLFFLGRNVGGEPTAVAAGERLAEQVTDLFAQWHGQMVEGLAVDEVTAAVFEEAAAQAQCFQRLTFVVLRRVRTEFVCEWRVRTHSLGGEFRFIGEEHVFHHLLRLAVDEAARGLAKPAGGARIQRELHGRVAIQGRSDRHLSARKQGVQVDLMIEHHEGHDVALVEKVPRHVELVFQGGAIHDRFRSDGWRRLRSPGRSHCRDAASECACPSRTNRPSVDRAGSHAQSASSRRRGSGRRQDQHRPNAPCTREHPSSSRWHDNSGIPAAAQTPSCFPPWVARANKTLPPPAHRSRSARSPHPAPTQRKSHR